MASSDTAPGLAHVGPQPYDERMDDVGAPRYKRIRLTGERFSGGRLPIDSLIELERYQRAIQAMAEHEWRRDHPGQSVPAEVLKAASLVIERIEDGSADVLLAFEQATVHQQYQEEARDAVDATIEAAYDGHELPALPSDVADEVRSTLAQFGTSLEPGQSIRFYPDGVQEPVEITIETRKVAAERLILTDFMQEPVPKLTSGITRDETSLVARVTVINAEDMKYELNSDAFGTIHGRYRDNPEMLDELRAVVNSTSEGPLTRIYGQLRQRDGKPWSFWTTTRIEKVEFDDTDWGRSLTRYASLPQGWAGGQGVQINSLALDAAQAVLKRIDIGARPVAMAPTEDGGVLLEWISDAGIRSVEVLEDGSYEMFEMERGAHRGTQTETSDATVAAAFVNGARS